MVDWHACCAEACGWLHVEGHAEQILEVVATMSRTCEAGSSFVSKEVTRPYAKGGVQTVTRWPGNSDISTTAGGAAMAACRRRICGALRGEAEQQHGEKARASRTEPQQASRVSSPM